MARTLLMISQFQHLLRTKESPNSLSICFNFPSHEKKFHSPYHFTRILSYHVVTRSKNIESSDGYNGVWLAHYLSFQILNISFPQWNCPYLTDFLWVKNSFFTKNCDFWLNFKKIVPKQVRISISDFSLTWRGGVGGEGLL